jgi:hypothetical protein
VLQKAIERNLPVMTEDWVHNVWLESCKRNVHASDPEFKAYKCPVFHGLIVTCSNLPRQQKEEIRKLINDNGEDSREYFDMTLGLEVPEAVHTKAVVIWDVIRCIFMVYQTVWCHVCGHQS